MKNKLIIPNVLLIIFLGAFVIWQSLKTPKIAYVKSSVLISKYQGFINATEQYRAKSSIWEANIDTLKNELQRSMQQFEKEKGGLTQKEKQLSMELIQNKQQQLRQYQEGIVQKAKTQDQEMTGKVLEEINAYVKEFGKENGYEIILGATEMGNIIYSTDALDITEVILEGLNKHYQ